MIIFDSCEIYDAYMNGEIIALETDVDGNILSANEVFYKVFKYSEDEIVCRNANILRDDCVPGELFADMWESIEKGDSFSTSFPSSSKCGERIWLSGTIFPRKDENSKVIGYLSLRMLLSDREIMAARKEIKDNYGKEC